MKQTIVLACVLALAIACQPASAQFNFTDDFEAGIGAWTQGGNPFVLSNAQNIIPAGGQYSAQLDYSADFMYHNLGWEADQFRFTFYLYDGDATRNFGMARSYSGAGYGDGTLQQIFAIGKYNSVTMPGEVYDATKYQARIMAGGTVGWFNLNGAGSPSRSAGWHKFDILRTGGNVVNFYVDDVLSRSFSDTTFFTVETLAFGLGAGTSTGNSWVDGVMFVPEPGGLLALGAGLASMAGLIRRRRA